MRSELCSTVSNRISLNEMNRATTNDKNSSGQKRDTNNCEYIFNAISFRTRTHTHHLHHCEAVFAHMCHRSKCLLEWMGSIDYASVCRPILFAFSFRFFFFRFGVWIELKCCEWIRVRREFWRCLVFLLHFSHSNRIRCVWDSLRMFLAFDGECEVRGRRFEQFDIYEH